MRNFLTVPNVISDKVMERNEGTYMKPEQIRERMELFGLGTGKKESDYFLKDVCDVYEEMYYALIEKEDKINSLNDAIRYYKNMEENMKQMLSTMAELSEKTEENAKRSAELTAAKAKNKASAIVEEARNKAKEIVEQAKKQEEEITADTDAQLVDAKAELEKTRTEIETVKAQVRNYSARFYDFMEAQKAFFEEHRFDVETYAQGTEFQAAQEITVKAEDKEEEQLPTVALPEPELEVDVSETFLEPTAGMPADTPKEGAEAVSKTEPSKVAAETDQVRKLSGREESANEKFNAFLSGGGHAAAPVSDHTETLDEIIQSIKRSYDEA